MEAEQILITLNVDDLSYQHSILKLISKNGKFLPLESTCKFYLDSNSYDEKSCKKVFKSKRLPSEGRFRVEYEDLEFEINIFNDNQYNNFRENQLGSSMGVSSRTLLTVKKFEIKYKIEDDEKILKMIEDHINDEDEYETKNLEIFFNEDNYWRKHHEIEEKNVQSFEQIFLTSNISEEIIALIDNFIALESKYNEFGITRKLTLLFEGKAGSGKSSIVRSIAHKYKRRMYILNLGNRETKENDLIQLFRIIKKDSILVLEDIDAFFVGRKTGTECATGVSFSTLINLLDGSLSTGNGLITFITANHAEHLDKALVRPGRIDKVVHFGDMTKDQFEAAWRARVSNTEAPDEELFKICQRNSLSMSALMYVFFFAKNTEERRNMARQSVSERSFSDSSNHMYS
jgi:SpoVK/Ycf46/Vps4 family AAA+-type ATPase